MTENVGYVPRKCSYTKRPIVASDHAAIQISVKKKEKNFSLVICGDMRKQGRSDEIINELIEKEDL